VELVSGDAPSPRFETDLASGFSTHPPGSQEKPAAASTMRPSLIGESRGQRMMLLASANSRPRKPAMAPPFSVPASKPETSRVQARDDASSDRSGERRGESGEPGIRPAALGSLSWAPRSTGLLADDRVSRSTMEGIAAFVLLAAGWFRKTHRRPRAFPQDLPGSGQFDSQQAAARDEFFGQEP
jgi:hypothetical protein